MSTTRPSASSSWARRDRRVRRVAAGLVGLTAMLAAGRLSAAPARCEAPLAVFRGGEEDGEVCPDQLAARGLTAIPLGEGWTPYVLAGAALAAGAAPPAYHETFVALAAEKFEAGSIAEDDGSLEFYGVPPNFRVVLARIEDEPRHRCHDAVADEALAADPGVMRWEPRTAGKQRNGELARKRALAQATMRRLGVRSLEALAAAGGRAAKLAAELRRAEAQAGAIAAMQAHLACDGLLPARGGHRGLFDWPTAEALRAYQRRHWIVASGELGPETLAAMRGDSRELELRLALRVLRRRVADAAGLIEDGSARAAWGTVLGRTLDGPEMQYQGGWPALANGAPDLVSAATEAAAAALGWKDLESVRASLRAHVEAERAAVAVALPPAPAYHRPGVELRAVVDRGDVSYDPPGAGRGATRRPVLIVYAKDGDRETALVRWPTTIGGWQDEQLGDGAVVRRYKPSDTGPRLWRDLVAVPVWYPPASTPDRELVRVRRGKWELKEELLGPGYRSAYGLAMLIHHLERTGPDGRVQLFDRAIRTHGSVNYQSIGRGDSHGCHRTYNHQILGLTSFLLRHHAYTVKGPLQETYVRTVRHGRSRFPVRRTDRGFYYELTPAVPVEVLEGTVVGRRKAPVKAPLHGRR